MSEAYWEMERRRLLGNRARDIEGYMALEYPRESVAAVLRMAEPRPRPNGRGPRASQPARASIPSGAPAGDPCP